MHEVTTLTSSAAVVYLQGIRATLYTASTKSTIPARPSVFSRSKQCQAHDLFVSRWQLHGQRMEAAAVFYTSIDGGKCWQLANVGFTLAQAPNTTYELVATPHSLGFGTDGTMFLTTVAYDTASDYNEAILGVRNPATTA